MGRLRGSLVKYQEQASKAKREKEGDRDRAPHGRPAKRIPSSGKPTCLLLPFHLYPIQGHREYVSPFPYSFNSRILLLGEGNFSFACALIRNLFRLYREIGKQSKEADADADTLIECGELKVQRKVKSKHAFVFIASSYEDSEEALLQKYPEAKANIEAIERLGGRIMYHVDATKLSTNKKLASIPFTRIIFNFPHLGAGIKDQVTNVNKHQVFLGDFFKSAKGLLSGAMVSSKDKSTARDEFSSSVSGAQPGGLRIGKTGYRTIQMKVAREDYLVPSETETMIRPRRGSSLQTGGSDEEGHETVEPLMALPVFEEQPEIHVTLKEGEPYDAWGIKKLVRGANQDGDDRTALAFRESFRFVKERYEGYEHVNTFGHFVPKAERPMQPCSGKERGEGHLEGKLCKTYVFQLKKHLEYGI